ncbi:periplasmic binding protein-like II [Glonium stellatum]|uniref:Periplasmic binding protein-like II n=1 Tax=Glonium stellatum TaxID=574774 RepID=A0A8E2EQL7_9PEZI|nr:periplasmic binding protein-like II [Glonium stellatum]
MNKLFLVLGLALILSNFLVSALKIASALNTIEYTPELVAIQDDYKGSAQIVNGGVASLFSDSSIDLASNAETQALRQYSSHKNLRIIYTVAEVFYRIVANKKSGISSPKDLKGKKIGTIPSTSAAYFVQKYLATVGLKESDYTVVPGSVCMSAPCGSGTLPYMLAHGSVDAVGMWEPTGELASEALGSDAVIFQNQSVYREIFNLHSTAEKLSDPTTRQNIVAFLRALNQAEKVFDSNPESVWSRVASALSMNATVLQSVWPIHSFKGTLVPDLLDVLVAEDQWVAKVDNRNAISKADLTNLIDSSVFNESLST